MTTNTSTALAAAFIAAGVEAPKVKAPAKAKLPAKPRVKAATKAKAKAKAKVNAATKEGTAQTKRDIAAAAAGKAASKLFKVSASAKASITRARAAMVEKSAAMEHAIKLAGGKTELFRAAMAKAYGNDWHTLKASNAETDADKARAMLIGQERVALSAACKAAKMSNDRKPWSDAGKAQEAFLATKALVDAGLDPALKEGRTERTMLQRIIKANLALYKAHQKEPSKSCAKATAAMFDIGRALIACGEDLTQANLAGSN